MAEKTHYEVERAVDSELTYTEHLVQGVRGERRTCAMRRKDMEEPISLLELLPKKYRFGGTWIESEGIGGVSTQRKFRGRGLMRLMFAEMTKAARERVDVLHLFGIDGLYDKFGFVACLPESSFSVWTRRTSGRELPPDYKLDIASEEDLPTIIDMYNGANRFRPWTAEREPGTWGNFQPSSAFHAGTEILVLRRNGTLCAYATFEEDRFGWHAREFTVFEAVAPDVETGTVLLVALAQQCLQRHLTFFTVKEPADSMVGLAAKKLSADFAVGYRSNGGGMIRALNRASLVSRLSGELERREKATAAISPEWKDSRDNAIEALAEGKLIPDDGALVRLLVGYWSWHEAELLGVDLPTRFRPFVEAWFPGGGVARLPIAHAHRADRY